MNDYSTSGSPGEQPWTSWSEMRNYVNGITWAWPGWLPKGFVVIIAGASGTGKSSLLLRICGCYTNGWDWPDGSPFTDQQGYVLWCEGEAAQALNLERAERLGLNTDLIITPFQQPLKDVNLDIAEHRKKIVEMAKLPEIKLIVIDSLRGANNLDENSSNMNEPIKFLAETSRDTAKSILLSHHFRKKSMLDGDVVDIERIRGSSAIVQTARVVWVIDQPSAQEETKRLRVGKSNLGKYPPALGFSIAEDGVKFGSPPMPPETIRPEKLAEQLLITLLKGKSLPVEDIRKAVEQAGIGWRTALKAKQRLGISSHRFGGKEGFWIWSLPDSSAE